MPIDLRLHAFDQSGNSLKLCSVQEIVKRFLGVDIEWDSSFNLSDWEVDELSLEQVRHAAVDAFVSYTIGFDLGAHKFNRYCFF